MNELRISLVSAILTVAIAIWVKMVWSRYVVMVIVPMHHRYIHSRNGKIVGILTPGKYCFIGKGHLVEAFDDRLQHLVLQTQELITVEGISVKVTAVGLYRIIDPLAATAATVSFKDTLYTMVQLALRDVICGIEAESLVGNVKALGPRLLEIVQPKAAELGLELAELVVRDVNLPADIKAALSECWRSKKAALAELEAARGKAAATRTLLNAARLYESHPALLRIRYVDALENAAKGQGNTFVVGINEEKFLKTI